MTDEDADRSSIWGGSRRRMWILGAFSSAALVLLIVLGIHLLPSPEGSPASVDPSETGATASPTPTGLLALPAPNPPTVDPTLAEPTTGATPGQAVTLFVYTPGDYKLESTAFGPSLKEQYEDLYPYVTLEVTTYSLDAMHATLRRALERGHGAPNIAIVDESYLPSFLEQPDDFVNLLDLGAGKYEDSFPAWKWDQAATADGSTVIGLGNESGGLAMCYRRDLFEAAGLPYERADVESAMGDSWAGFIEFGQAFRAGSYHYFIDDAQYAFWPALQQLTNGHGLYDGSTLDMASIKPAYDLVIDIIKAGLSADVRTTQAEWGPGLSNGDFAVTLCPMWMLDDIQARIDEEAFAGQWDIADLPGPGGNWGGSFFTLPAQGSSYEQQQAYRFVEWLIQPEQQQRLAQELGAVSSQPTIDDDSAIASLTNPFFTSAPVGQIFSKAIEDIPASFDDPPVAAKVRAAIERTFYDVQVGNVAIVDAWDHAVAAAEAVNSP